MVSNNIPQVKLGIIAVSRDCFPIALSTQRRENIVKEYKGEIFNCQTTVENEKDMLKAVSEVKEQGCNALVVFLGNFGPETPETLIAKNFDGPVMFVAAAEGDGDMINGRGDAYCGMLNCSYNLGMRHLKGYIPEYPVGTAAEVAKMIQDFVPVARVILGLKGLKIITFGPRPQDFFACNAPIKGLYELGVEIEENDPQIADEYPVMAAIGQSNNNYATIQLGRYVSAIANDGNVYEYTLLSKVCDSDGNTLETFEPKVRNTVDVLDTTQWNAIHTGMRMVVENLSTFDNFSIEVAGKTGTAQQSPNRPNHALFVGYAPYNDPEISIATRIAFGYTSHNAAEYAKNVFSYYFGVQDAEELLNGQAENVGESSNSFND